MRTYDFRNVTTGYGGTFHFSANEPRLRRKRRAVCDSCKHMAQYEGDVMTDGKFVPFCDAQPHACFNGKTESKCKLHEPTAEVS